MSAALSRPPEIIRPKRFGRLMFEALPLMIALIAGALIVAAALLIIFL